MRLYSSTTTASADPSLPEKEAPETVPAFILEVKEEQRGPQAE